MDKIAKALTLFLALFIPIFTCHALEANQEAKKQEAQPVKNPIVVFETNLGNFEITLKPAVAPKTCENFLGLVAKHYYDGIVFHRVIKNFMIQGGDPTATGAGGESIWGKPFADEFNQNVKFDKPGVLAMANRGPNTNGSQFFVTTAMTPWLNMRHTIFGEVTKGYEIVKKIEESKTGPGDRPVEAVKILKAYVKKED